MKFVNEIAKGRFIFSFGLRVFDGRQILKKKLKETWKQM